MAPFPSFRASMPTITRPFRPLLASLLLAAAAVASAESVLQGRVVGVSDGDTLTVLSAGHDQHRVRLAEIDAPEKSQAYGQRSKQSLSDLVYGKAVTVEVQDTDRYGRLIGQVYAEGVNVNSLQVDRGMAWVYRRYNKTPALLGIEERARAARRGLWADPSPVPPWDYRRQQRNGDN